MEQAEVFFTVILALVSYKAMIIFTRLLEIYVNRDIAVMFFSCMVLIMLITLISIDRQKRHRRVKNE